MGALTDWEDPGLDFEVPSEPSFPRMLAHENHQHAQSQDYRLFQRNLGIRTHQYIRALSALPLAPPPLLPPSFHRQSAQMNCLAAPCRCRPNRCLSLWNTPQIRNHADAPRVDRHQRRVLVCVSQVLTNVLENQLVAFWLHERIHERGQVEVWPSVEVQLILDDLVHGLCVSTRIGDLEFGHLGASGVAGAVDVVVGCGLVMATVAFFAERGDEFIGVDLGRGVSGDSCLKEGLKVQLRVLRATWSIFFYMSKSNTTLVTIRYRSRTSSKHSHNHYLYQKIPAPSAQ